MVSHQPIGRRAGFSMLEVSISSLLVGILLTGAMVTTGQMILRDGLRAQHDRKMLIAHELLSEITQVAYSDPDSTRTELGTEFGESSGTRSAFDDVDDYDGWNETALTDKQGQLLNGWSGYQRSVQVVYARLLEPNAASEVDTGLKRIVISVTGPDGQTYELVALRAQRGALEAIPATETTFVRGVRIELTAAQDGGVLRTGVGLLNPIASESTP